MSRHGTQTTDGGATDSRSLPRRTAAALRRRCRNGSLATLTGSVLLGLALRAIRSRRDRATLLGLAGLGALGVGVRQRRAASGTERVDTTGERVETGTDARRSADGEKVVSDDAHAQVSQDLGAGRTADESASAYEPGTDPNPRGVGGGVDDETDQGGDVEFVEGESPEPHRETHLEDEDAHDPRLHPDSDAEQTQVDLSEAAMADEASEAAGPHPEQAYPASEGTDPEPTAAKAPESVAGNEVASGPDEDESGAVGEVQEPESGGPEERTDGQEANDRDEQESNDRGEQEADDRGEQEANDRDEGGTPDRAGGG